MVKPRRGVLLLVAGGLLAAAWLLWPHKPAPPPAKGPAPVRRGRAAGSGELPRIDLARLDELNARPKVEPGKRDPGDFYSPPKPPAPPPMEPAPVVVSTPAGPPPPPVLNLTYLGSLESRAGLRVAVFLTDKKMVVTAREGEVAGSRIRVVKIGLESVDVEDVMSGRTQRMALPKKGAGAETARDAKDKEPGGVSR